MNAEAKIKKLTEWIEKHRTLFEVFLDGYVLVDSERKIVQFNEAFMELTGESYRKIMKAGYMSALIKTEKGDDWCVATDIVRTGTSQRIDELNASTKAYPTAKFIVGGVPILADDSTVLGALVTIRNVSAESELQKKYDERKKDAIQDGLTKLYNKSYAEKMLDRLVKTAMRSNTYISVMMCDIDHFKKVNDTYGHQAGDHVLATVSGILKDESRDTDLVGRFGGEEFICILTGTDVAGSLIFAERFRHRIEQTKIEFEGTHIPVTVSLGTSTFRTQWVDGLDPAQITKEIVGKADTALYYAKANGRNKACQFETLPANDGSRQKTMPKKAA